ncbi:MAG TPA: Na+/H+ antiporter subunit A [Actinomycetales bacterium]|nr:Na+/H+ antiporter subunit A [Actinomycetales bacterium]
MIALLLAHVAAAGVAPALVRRWGRRAFLALAVPPAAAAVWAAVSTAAIHDGHPVVERYRWIDGLHLELGFRADTLTWLMVLVVGGIGAIVLVYCAGYFSDDEPLLGRFAANLTAFAGAMLGLVTSDDLLMLYLFWEVTTVLSYLLIGHTSELRPSRSAATQALVVTTAGGLAMLVGIVLLGERAGTYQLSEILADPPRGPLVTTAVVLLIVGAVTKSALIPFHFWLPSAMAAPTPVSAYLHAAAMVKAGIYLVARLAPGFSDVPLWRPVLLTLGGATMLLGGWRALRQHDLKLLLAFGTVSQLGFLTVLVGTGSRAAALAGTTLLLAHALFKACLFLVVGIVDHATGSRDLRVLSGLGRSLPVVAGCGVLAAASMAGLPPLLGFVGKEAAYETFLHSSAPGSTWVLVVLVAGSILTFAYSARFVWGAFAERGPRSRVVRPDAYALVGPVLLAAGSVVVGVLSTRLETLTSSYSRLWPADGHAVHLGLWHGVTPALGLSALTVLGGAGLFAVRGGVERLQAAVPTSLDAQRSYRATMRSLDRASLEVTGGLQRGSLPLTLGLILSVLVIVPGGSLLLGVTWPDEVRWWDTPAQGIVALVVLVAAYWTARSRRRLRAVILVGITGYGTAMLFLLHGAPDLALTQVLVETVSLVVFVLVVRRLPQRFSDTPPGIGRWARATLGLLVGAVMTGLALTATTVREAIPVSVDFPRAAVEFGGGRNIVNVTLVDIRAWDTMGELSVVLVSATGVASLVFLRQRFVDRARQALERTRSEMAERPPGRGVGWLARPMGVASERRSVMFEVVTRLVFHTVALWSLFLLFSGHNNPGGGFSAGLVLGLGLTMRYLAGGRSELRAALPVSPGALLGAGMVLAAGTSLVTLAFGGEALQSWIFHLHVPLLGDVHLVTSLFFDIGVYLVVVGLMLDILRSLGSAIDDQIEQESELTS